MLKRKAICLMVCIVLLVEMVSTIQIIPVYANNSTYYVSYTDGNDNNNGISSSTPWKTLAKVSSMTFSAGDQILLKCGDTWSAQTLTLQGSGTPTNPIILSSYGTGNRPIISPNAVDSICIAMNALEGWKITNLELCNAKEGIELKYDHVYNKNYIWIENVYFHDMDHSKCSLNAENMTNEQLSQYLDWNYCSAGIYVRGSVDPGKLSLHNQPVLLQNLTIKSCNFYNCDMSFSCTPPVHPGFNYGWEDYGRISGLTLQDCQSNHIGMIAYSLEFVDNGTVKNVSVDDVGYEWVRYGSSAWVVAYCRNVTFDGLFVSNVCRNPRNPYDGCGFDFEGANDNCRLINSTITGTDGYAILVTKNMDWPNTNFTIANNTISDWSRNPVGGFPEGAIYFINPLNGISNGTICNNKYISTNASIPDYNGANSTVIPQCAVNNNTRYNLTSVAQGKTVTSSSNNGPNYTASYAVDGNTGTYWCASSGSFPQWIDVDLGSQQKLAFVKQITQVSEPQAPPWGALTRYYYKIEGSNDNTNWDLLVDKTGSGSAGQWYTDEARGMYRYVKLTITGSSDGNWAALSEFQVYTYNSPDINLAANATVTASSTYNDPSYAAGYTTDGDNGTATWKGWCSTINSLPAWVQLDFGQNKSFNRVEIYTKKGYEQKEYTVQYWDGLSWKNCFDEIIGNKQDHRTHSFPTITGSKLRVYMTDGNVQQSNFARLSEIEVYNDMAVSAIPTVIQTPYLGADWNAGKIEAEDYNNGGEGIAYHDTDAINQGGAYRTDGVDIEATTDTGGGYNISNIYDGEWLQYSMLVPVGTFDITLRTQGWGTAHSVNLLLDGTLIGTFYPPTNGAWTDVTLNNVNITSGGHKLLKLAFVGYNNELKVNYIKFSQSKLKTWNFNLDSNTLDWTSGNITGFTTSGGYLTGSYTSNDPQLYSPDNLGITNIQNSLFVTFTMRNVSSGQKARVFFTTNTDTTFSQSKSMIITLNLNTSTNQPYSVYMGDLTSWTGTLKQLRIDPVDDGTSSGSFYISNISVLNGYPKVPEDPRQ